MATLRVIDAASHQGNMNQAAMDFDALIVKATEGTGYINPYCDGEFQEALKLGKKLGVYHFARNTLNSAEAEANYFIKNTKGYIGKAIPVLDWEDKKTSDVAWALKWLQLVEKAYGCKPLIYMSEAVVNAYNWSSVANGNLYRTIISIWQGPGKHHRLNGGVPLPCGSGHLSGGSMDITGTWTALYFMVMQRLGINTLAKLLLPDPQRLQSQLIQTAR